MVRRFALLYLLLAGAWWFLYAHHDRAVPVRLPLELFPVACGSWRMVGESRFDEETLKLLRPTAYLSRQYAGADGTRVNLYVGYHDGSKGSGEIHSPRNCLPGSGWTEVSSRRQAVPTGDGTMKIASALYRKGETRELFLYWFQVRDRALADEYSLKFAEATSSLLSGRRDAAFIRVSVPVAGNEAAAMDAGTSFIREIHPHLRQFLPL